MTKTITLTGGLTLSRIGYGAMQLAGPNAFGPPRDRAAAVQVLRTYGRKRPTYPFAPDGERSVARAYAKAQTCLDVPLTVATEAACPVAVVPAEHDEGGLL